jgi:hypothetical protein
MDAKSKTRHSVTYTSMAAVGKTEQCVWPHTATFAPRYRGSSYRRLDWQSTARRRFQHRRRLGAIRSRNKKENTESQTLTMYMPCAEHKHIVINHPSNMVAFNLGEINNQVQPHNKITCKQKLEVSLKHSINSSRTPSNFRCWSA